MNIVKKGIPYLVSAIILLVFHVIMFSPQLDNKILPAGDLISSQARTMHIQDYQKEHGERSFWNPSEFAGNPIYLLNLGKSNNYIRYVSDALTLKISRPIGMFFMISIIMFISLCLLGVNPWLSLVLSMVYSLSTYYFILLEAGHAKKINTVAYFPFILAGVILSFRGKLIKGFIPILIGTSLAIYHGHVQMVLYLLIALFVFAIPYFIHLLKDGKIPTLSKGIGVMLAAAALGGLTNYAQLVASQEFSKSTMRGEAVLASEKDAIEAVSSSEVDGLEWSYAMSWSYEIGDFLGILVPRVVGGSSSEPVSKDEDLAKLILQNGGQAKDGKVAITGYWSTMLFTSGPPYVGATLLFLFVFSIVAFWKTPLAHASIGVFVILFFLSLGENATWINRLFFEYFPLFNKFRAPSSIIIIAPVFFTITAGVGLEKFFNAKDKSQFLQPLIISVGIVGGIAFIIAFFGSMFSDYITAKELSQYQETVKNAFINTRKSMQQGDALRSLLFIAATAGSLFVVLKDIVKFKFFLPIALGVLFLLDMIPVNRRYLNNADYVNANVYKIQFQPSAIDQQIFAKGEKSRGDYRVLDLSTNTFNDAKPSMYHNQIGGYNPAKLQRFQDIIDNHIQSMNMEVLNMLNVKYVVTQQGQVQTNQAANGPAWFVSNIQYVNTPQEEIDALKSIATKTTAVVNATDFESSIKTGEGTISLTAYEPNKLTYNSNSTSGGLVVFSEVWYGGNPDWTVTIDNEPADFIRANYILRAMEVPAGAHTIVFEFKPKAKGAIVSTMSSLLGLILLFLAIGYGVKQLGEEKQTEAL